jgi:hypothetical protein
MRILRYVHDQGPLKSFQDISLATNITLEQVHAVAGHLVFWGKGQVIDTLHKHSMFRVNPSADLYVDGALANDFRAQFWSSVSATIFESPGNMQEGDVESSDPAQETTRVESGLVQIGAGSSKSGDARVMSMSTVLAFLCEPGMTAQPRTLAELMSAAPSRLGLDSELFLQMIAWLLRKRVIVQVHVYVFLVVPSAVVTEPVAAMRKSPSTSSVIFSLSDEDREVAEEVDEYAHRLQMARYVCVFVHM